MVEMMKSFWGYAPLRRVFVLSFFDGESRLRGFDEVGREETEEFCEAYGRAYDMAEKWCEERGFQLAEFEHFGGV